jgi:hypothetical protein
MKMMEELKDIKKVILWVDMILIAAVKVVQN